MPKNMRPMVDREQAEATLPPSIEAAQALVEALIGGGVERVAYCPGSRNAPLAYALAAAEEAGYLRVFSFVEERGAAFWALGVAKAKRGVRPVAVVTTSGTAVAELLPALQEARHQGLPLIAVTADRPFELVGVGASQATRQAGLLSASVVLTCDIPAGATSGGIHNRVRRVLARASGYGGNPGPTHVNIAFADPLTPPDISRYLGTAFRCEQSPVVPTPNRPGQIGHGDLASTWDEVVLAELRTVVVAGDIPAAEVESGAKVALEAGRRLVPVLAEPSSNLTTCPTWIPHAPWIVGRLADQVEQVIVVGKPTLSRPVNTLLSRPHIRKIAVCPGEEWPDLSGTAAVVIPGLQGGQGSHESVLGPRPAPREESQDHDFRGSCADRHWLERWRAEAAHIEAILAEHQDRGQLDAVDVAREIWTRSAGVDLWIGASNAIRAFDIAAPLPGREDVFSNRGLAGIDGTIASAQGLHSVRGKPMRIVLGDLTFCYDLTSLARPAEETENVQILVLDDGGGSIFASLEHGHAPEALYEKYFGVRQNVDFIKAAQAFGWEPIEVVDTEHLREVLNRPVRGRSVVHIRIDRPANLLTELHRQVVDRVSLKGTTHSQPERNRLR